MSFFPILAARTAARPHGLSLRGRNDALLWRLVGVRQPQPQPRLRPGKVDARIDQIIRRQAELRAG